MFRLIRGKKLLIVLLTTIVICLIVFFAIKGRNNHSGDGSSATVQQETTEDIGNKEEKPDAQTEKNTQGAILENDGEIEIVVPEGMETTGE